jgi:predicted alpha/beta-hydrolase family hydrolase
MSPCHDSNMASPPAASVRIPVGTATVAGLMLRPRGARACFVFAHGAGAGMCHPFMLAMAEKLAEHRIATLRYQFPFMQAHAKRPDPPTVCHATVRAAVRVAHSLAPKLRLFAGGKSFGGRMTSQAQAILPLEHVAGLAFFGFPLHAAGKPGITRAEHLDRIEVPLLFLQGTRDALAEPARLRRVVKRLGEEATLEWFKDADHSFHVPVRSGRSDEQVRAHMAQVLAAWIATIS